MDVAAVAEEPLTSSTSLRASQKAMSSSSSRNRSNRSIRNDDDDDDDKMEPEEEEESSVPTRNGGGWSTGRILAVVALLCLAFAVVLAGGALGMYYLFPDDDDDCDTTSDRTTGEGDKDDLLETEAPTAFTSPPTLAPTPSVVVTPLTIASQLQASEQHERFGASLAMSQDGSVLAVGSANGWLVYDVNDDTGLTASTLRTDSLVDTPGQRRQRGLSQRLKAPVSPSASLSRLQRRLQADEVVQVALSGDGTLIGTVYPIGLLEILSWDGATWTLVDTTLTFAVSSVAISQDGQTVVVGDASGGLFQSYRYLSSSNRLFFRGTLDMTADGDTSIGRVLATSVHGEVVVTPTGSTTDQEAVTAYVWDYDTESWTMYGDAPVQPGTGGAPIDALALSSLGRTLAVGTGGSVYVYEFTGSAWIQQSGTPLVGTDPSFGSSVALDDSGTVLIVGAPESNALSPLAGQVQVYSLVNDQWQQIHEPTHGASPNDEWGAAVAVAGGNGQRIVVGADQKTLPQLLGYVGILER